MILISEHVVAFLFGILAMLNFSSKQDMKENIDSFDLFLVENRTIVILGDVLWCFLLPQQ